MSQMLNQGSDDMLIKIWSVKSAKLLATLRGHEKPISCMDVNYENSLLASGSTEKRLIIWDLETTKVLYSLSEGSRSTDLVKVEVFFSTVVLNLNLFDFYD